ncbi:type II secretion system protein GspG [Verrucomicrobiota bacterium]
MNRQVIADRQLRAGFTLIEVMLVVIIIGILATVVVTRFTGQGERARINATHLSIKNVCTAIDMYETDTGKLPSTLSDLTKETEDHGALLASAPVDSWGTELQYKSTGKFSYEVRSAGPDTEFGNDDDLTNK